MGFHFTSNQGPNSIFSKDWKPSDSIGKYGSLCDRNVIQTEDHTHSIMVYSDEMMLLIRNLLFIEAKGDNNCNISCLCYIVSITRDFGTRKVSFSVRFLCGRRDESMDECKGRGKRSVSQVDDLGRGTRAQRKALWEARMYELELPSEIQQRVNDA